MMELDPASFSEKTYERAAGLFESMGNEARLKLLVLLIHGEAPVSELAERMGENISTISQRLKLLYDQNLVVKRRDGKQIFYALADQHIVEVVLNVLQHASEA